MDGKTLKRTVANWKPKLNLGKNPKLRDEVKVWIRKMKGPGKGWFKSSVLGGRIVCLWISSTTWKMNFQILGNLPVFIDDGINNIKSSTRIQVSFFQEARHFIKGPLLAREDHFITTLYLFLPRYYNRIFS